MSNVPMIQCSNVQMFQCPYDPLFQCVYLFIGSQEFLVYWSIGPLVYWSIGPKVTLLSERTSGVPPVIFTSIRLQYSLYGNVTLDCKNCIGGGGGVYSKPNNRKADILCFFLLTEYLEVD